MHSGARSYFATCLLDGVVARPRRCEKVHAFANKIETVNAAFGATSMNSNATERATSDHASAERYRLTIAATFRVTRCDAVEITLPHTRLHIPLDRFQVLLHFASPSTIADVFDLIDGGVDLDAFTAIVRELAKQGLLEQQQTGSEPSERANSSLLTYLNAAYCGEETWSAVKQQLAAGQCVVLENAFKVDFAERMFKCLDEFDDWKPYEDYSMPDFHFHHHNVYEKGAFPSDLVEGDRIFSSRETKAFVARLSGRDCEGDVTFSGSLYLPGDCSLPHTDCSDTRNVAFVWHLTKEWRREWGGALYWCSSCASIPPSFNTLVLFNVSEVSAHFVAPVNPMARAKRLAINGWWHARSSETIVRSLPSSYSAASTSVVRHQAHSG